METKEEKTALQQQLEARTTMIEEDIRGPYFRDQTKIIHSLPFRRLKDKTQVVPDPTDDHVCTRVEHVLHVATVSKSICRGLNKKENSEWNLDEDLAFAIGLGHDLGHAPFGHAGEKILSKLLGNEHSFMHELHGFRVVEILENMDLTYAVKDGIICHNGEKFEQFIKPREETLRDELGNLVLSDLSSFANRKNYPATYEGCIVRFSDKISYLGRDIEDALKTQLILETDLDEQIKKRTSLANRDIINYCVTDLINSSSKTNGICFSTECHNFMDTLRRFNYKNIYEHPRLENYQLKCEKIIQTLFEYLTESYRMYNWINSVYNKERNSIIDHCFASYIMDKRKVYDKEIGNMKYNDLRVEKRVITDFIAGMTDRFALRCFKDIMLPLSL